MSFNIYESYKTHLLDDQISAPLAGILALTEMIKNSDAGTMFELTKELKDAAESLRTQSSNPIGLSAGCELFVAFVTLFPHDSAQSFSDLRSQLVQHGEKYVEEGLTYRQKIAQLSLAFIKDDSVILTHSYSRVVMKTLLHAHQTKRISVYVTEARPRGLGVKTYEALTAAGIPCTIVLDSAVAYVMDKVDFCLVGSEAVVESGGLINAVGSNQIAVIAKAANKPFYALAESYKFHRLFPLNTYDLPTHTDQILALPRPVQRPMGLTARPSVMPRKKDPNDPSAVDADSSSVGRSAPEEEVLPTTMSVEQMKRNPQVDYTRPDLISLVFSDVGSLTPEGVSQYLVGMFAG